MADEKQNRSKYQQSRIDEIKQKAPDLYKFMLDIKKKFGSFTIKNLKFKEK